MRLKLLTFTILVLASNAFGQTNARNVVANATTGNVTWPATPIFGNASITGNLTLATGNATSAATGNATGLTAGTLPDARLSSNVVLTTSANNVFSGNITTNGTITGANGNITGNLTLSFGNATAAASGNATGLTSGTLADARLSGNVIQFAKNNTTADNIRIGTGSASGTINSDAERGLYLRPSSGRAGIQVVHSDGTGPTLFAVGGGYGHLTGGASGLVLQVGGGVGDVLFFTPTYALFTSGYEVRTNKLSIGNGTAITAVLTASASIDFSNTSAQTTNSGNTITVTGVSTTNTPSVQIGLSGALPTGCSVHGIVTSSNTVTLYFVNGSASSQDPGALTIRATVTQF